MQAKNVSIKELLKESGITFADVALDSGTSRADVCRCLDDDLQDRIKNSALRLVRERNLKVANQLSQYE